MSVRNQAGQAPMSSTMGREEERAAHGDPRKGSAAIAVTAVGMAVLILAAAFAAGRRSSPRSTTSVAAAAQAGGPSAAIGSSRLRMAVRWVDGLDRRSDPSVRCDLEAGRAGSEDRGSLHGRMGRPEPVAI